MAAVEPEVAEPSRIENLTPEEAFAAGVAAEQKRGDSRMARDRFVARWLQQSERLTEELELL